MILYTLAIVFLAAYLAYTFYLHPKKMRKYYARVCRKHGYKAIELPFSPLGAPFYEEQLSAAKDKKDSFYYHKHHYYNYDIIISNLVNNSHLIVLNP